MKKILNFIKNIKIKKKLKKKKKLTKLQTATCLGVAAGLRLSPPTHFTREKHDIYRARVANPLLGKNLENSMHTRPLICCQLWNFMCLSCCLVMERIQVLVLLIMEGDMCLIQCCPAALKKDVCFSS
jgi:hypothetical protein